MEIIIHESVELQLDGCFQQKNNYLHFGMLRVRGKKTSRYLLWRIRHGNSMAMFEYQSPTY